jgi:hypothetical protein
MSRIAKEKLIAHAERLLDEGRAVLDPRDVKHTNGGHVPGGFVVPPPATVYIQRLTKWLVGCANLVNKIGSSASAWSKAFRQPSTPFLEVAQDAAYFTGADEPYERLKRALKAEIDEAAWSALYSTSS